MEEWKDINGYEGYYQVSNLGRVKSLPGQRGTTYRKERILTKCLTRDGYEKVRLQHEGTDRTARVHRLVAEAFIPNPDNKETVNHIDGNKLNNVVSNLEWVDRYEQMRHAYRLGLKTSIAGAHNSNAKLSEDDVRAIRKEYVRMSRTHGTVALAKKYGVTNRIIGLVVNRKAYKDVE